MGNPSSHQVYTHPTAGAHQRPDGFGLLGTRAAKPPSPRQSQSGAAQHWAASPVMLKSPRYAVCFHFTFHFCTSNAIPTVRIYCCRVCRQPSTAYHIMPSPNGRRGSLQCLQDPHYSDI